MRETSVSGQSSPPALGARVSRPRWRWLGRRALKRLGVFIAVVLVAQSVQQSPSHTGATVRIDPSTTRLADGPAPSGADPAYPLNHTLDGKTADLGHVANSDFEKPSVPVGTPPSNSGFETSPADAPAVPNGDFETGDFTGWTTTGTPSIQTDPSRGYWARVPSGTLTTSALDVPSNAQALIKQTPETGTWRIDTMFRLDKTDLIRFSNMNCSTPLRSA